MKIDEITNMYKNIEGYNDKIAKIEEQLVKIKEDRELFLKELLKLKPGDIVHISESYDFFPQRILKIDLENLSLTVIEESINKISVINSFFVENENGNYRFVS